MHYLLRYTNSPTARLWPFSVPSFTFSLDYMHRSCLSWCHEKSAPVVYIGMASQFQLDYMHLVCLEKAALALDIGMASQFPLWNGVTVPVRLHASRLS